eukprot:NODE_990_length_1186_cov_295.074758_g751_i0.p1 GENE.NODE_990_length_1186_cov_295.074758_g751_i0~~NODE_990_length_1186_cov_295.074758_g751_i0.p1  ORF type:complete len:359 (-),score=89.20 NODE_990_length_1186_cov_295.074758_g751_i0:109-1128(-)
MSNNSEWKFVSVPEEVVTESIMSLEDVAVPTAESDGDVVIKTTFISLDPYMRGRMKVGGKSYVGAFIVGEALRGGATGVVTESKDPNFEVGDHVVGNEIPWRRTTVVRKETNGLNKIKVSDAIPASFYLGTLGMPGMSAYLPTLHIGQPKAGETVFISGAAGAVGSTVGQICKLKGCTVVGAVGSDEKVEMVKNLGFDDAFNYKKIGIQAALKQFCPKGIDMYWDNVGGEILEAAITNMNPFGRIVACGMISQYNKKPEDCYGVKTLIQIVGKQIRMEGFIISNRWNEDKPAAMAQLAAWVQEGKIKPIETVVPGFEKLASSFVGLFAGENTGKLVIQV